MAPRLDSKKLRDFISTSKGKSYTVAISTVALILLLVVVGIFPAVNSILYQVQENDRKLGVLGTMDTKITTIRSLVQQEQLKPTISAALDKALPNGVSQEVLFDLINQGASENSVTINSLAFGEPSLSRKLPLVFIGLSPYVDSKIVTITLTGPKDDLEKFLSFLENTRRIFNVQSVSMFKLEDESGVVTSSTPSGMNISSEVYFWNTNKQLN